MVKCLILMIIAGLSLSKANSQEYLLNAKEKTFKGVVESFNNYWDGRENKKGTGFKAFKRAEYFFSGRLNEKGELPNYREVYTKFLSYQQKLKKEDRILATNEWSFMGPFTRPEKNGNDYRVGTGRVSCIEIDPTNENILWAGASTGGVWKSTDKGKNWVTFPATELLSIGISSIAVAPSNHNIIYASTGDADIAGMFGIVLNYSVGILKSTNGGTSWSLVSPVSNMAPENKYYINKVLVHPTNPNLVIAASNGGLFISSNGGGAWTKAYSGSVREIKFLTNNTNVIIGAGGANGGFNLFKYSIAENKYENKASLNSCSRVAIATTAKNPKVLYAVASNWNMGFHSLMRSADAGETWTTISSPSNAPNILHRDYSPASNDADGQGMYDLAIAASPTNEDEVYVGGINIWKSVDGGRTWAITGYWLEGMPAKFIHADHHDFKFNSKGELFVGHDGGLSYSADKGLNWIDISDNLHITQFYRLSNSVNPPGLIWAGTQDNGTMGLEAGTWTTEFGGDGFETWINPNNTNIRYISNPYGVIYKTSSGGGSFRMIAGPYTSTGQGSWLTPYIIDPLNSSIMYAGYKELWKSTNGGDSWTATSQFGISNYISAIAVAPSNSNYVYAAIAGRVNKSTDGGKTWAQIYSAGNSINYIAVDPTNTNRIWLALGGFSSTAKVIKIDGTNVTNLSTGLPNLPINCVVYQKNSNGRIYVGTDAGVYTRDNSNQVWKQFGTGLPNVVIMELDIHYGTGKMRAATYGRGLWEVDVIDCNLASPELKVTGETSFCAGDSVTLEAVGTYTKFEWNTGASTPKITVKEGGTYFCTVYDSKGCNSTTTPLTVEVKAVKPLEVRPATSGPFCEGDTIELKATSLFSNYKWNTGETSKSIFVTKAGKYSCSATYVTGCNAKSENYELVFLPKPPKPTVTMQDNNILVATPAESHQWYKDNMPIKDAVANEYQAEQEGKYFVEITDKNGCKTRSEIIEVTTVSVEDNNAEGIFNAHPNPASSNVTITANIKESGTVIIEITDNLGLSLFKANDEAASGLYSKNIDLSKFSSGIYYIKLKSSGETRIIKISVEK